MYDFSHRRAWKPIGRSWDVTLSMLQRMLPHRAVHLLCIGCKGAHTVNDPHLVIRCVCGAVTVYRQHVLFFMWNSLTWWCNRQYILKEPFSDPYVEALRFYATTGPNVEHNTRVQVSTYLGAVTVNKLVISEPVELRIIAWRRRVKRR